MIGNLPQGLFGLGQMAAANRPLVTPTQDVAATQPFVWGKGGARLTPDEIARQRQQAGALQLAGMDTSPVGHWSQGAARVAQALVGALQDRSAEKASEESAARSDVVLQALLGSGDSNAAAAAMADPYLSPEVRGIAEMQYRKSMQQPHYWESNDGSLMVIDKATGLPKKLYDDPDLKMQWVPDGLGGGMMVPIPKSSQSAGMAPTQLPTFTADDWDAAPNAGGPTPPASGGF